MFGPAGKIGTSDGRHFDTPIINQDREVHYLIPGPALGSLLVSGNSRDNLIIEFLKEIGSRG